MEIGLQLPHAQPGADAASILEVARRAEELGFDSVWMFDHLFTPVGLETPYPYSGSGDYPMSADDPYFDALGLYGVIAGATERLKIGTGVLIGAYRHPLMLGKILATIENFAPGRIVLGLGSGWMREEFETLGVPYERRGARLDEYVRALRAVWSGRAGFDGEFYAWPEAGTKPAPTAPIPIIIGGHGDKALARAARLGDGWAIVTVKGQGSGLPAIEARVEVVKGFLEREGRDPEGFHFLFQHPCWISDHANEKMPLTGPPEEIAANLKRLQDLGVTMVDLLVFGPAAVIGEVAERFASEVRPLL